MTACATTIVVVRTPDDLSIAADSMGTFRDDGGIETARAVCKIYQIGDVFLGVAGLADDPPNKFNIAKIVAAAMGRGQSFAERMTAASAALRPALVAEASALKRNRPRDFDALADPRNGGIAIILIGVEKRSPAAIGQQFRITGAVGGVEVEPSRVKECPGSDCPGGVYVFHLGSAAAIESYLETHRRIDDSASLARRLVQLEIDNPIARGVGAPIDLLRISATGPQWLSRKPACPIVVRDH